MAARSSCTGSLRAGHPICPAFAGLQRLTDGTLPGGVSQGEPESAVAARPASGTESAPPASPVQGARSTGRLASGRGSAALRMNLTACGNATVPERLEIKSKTTAGMLRGAEYIFFSRPDL